MKFITKFHLLTLLAVALLAGFVALRSSTAPDVTFVTVAGKEIPMKALQGKVVLVNFWSTDCGVCVAEMPDLIATHQQFHPKGLEIIAVTMPSDPPAQLMNYLAKHPLPFAVMHDGLAQVVAKFGGVAGTPTTYLYDKQGKRLQYVEGKIDFADLHKRLSKELG